MAVTHWRFGLRSVNYLTQDRLQARYGRDVSPIVQRGDIAMPATIAVRDNTSQTERPIRNTRQTGVGLHRPPAIIVPQTGLCIYVARQR
jgi:hypothetical protein